MKITIISPLGVFESAETDALSFDAVVARLGKDLMNGLNLIDAQGVLTLIPNTMIPNSVIRVTGCLPNPTPEPKPKNVAVVE